MALHEDNRETNKGKKRIFGDRMDLSEGKKTKYIGKGPMFGDSKSVDGCNKARNKGNGPIARTLQASFKWLSRSRHDQKNPTWMTVTTLHTEFRIYEHRRNRSFGNKEATLLKTLFL